MAITFPLSLPTTPGFNSAIFSARSVVSLSQSIFTLKQQAQEHQGDLWEVSVSLPSMQRAAAEEWLAFFLSLNGVFGTFLIGDPLGKTPRGSVPGSPLVNGASQTGKSLITDGWTPSQNGVLLAGDYFQLGTGTTTRLYKVLTDVGSDGGGNATFDIWPRLRESPDDLDPLVTTNSKGTFRLTDNVRPWSENLPNYYAFSFVAMEAI